jgi:hypothetical protein
MDGRNAEYAEWWGCAVGGRLDDCEGFCAENLCGTDDEACFLCVSRVCVCQQSVDGVHWFRSILKALIKFSVLFAFTAFKFN